MESIAGQMDGIQRLDVHSLSHCGSLDEVWRRTTVSCGSALTKDWGLRVLRSGLDESVRTVVAETRYLCKDHRNLYSHYYSKKFVPGSAECTRLHFFARPDIDDDVFRTDPSAFQSDYMGFSVVRPVAQRCLGRTIIRSPSRDSGVHCLSTPFKVHVRGQALTVAGFPYTSQDTDATVCAHSALWATCRYLSEKYSVYREVHPYDLIEWTAPHLGRRVPHRGMNCEDYSTILSAFGAHPEVLRLQRSEGAQDSDRFAEMCSYVESGFPILASIRGHVIVVVGHTLDFTKIHHPGLRMPASDELGFVESCAYWKQLIVVDDNVFPYARFGFSGDTENYLAQFDYPEGESSQTIENIRTAVVPLPEKVYLPWHRARKQVQSLFRESREVADAARQGSNWPLVSRLFLTNGSSWKHGKIIAWRESQDKGSADPLLSIAADFRLPHFVWVLQTAPLDLYREGFCTAEIVLDATAGQADNAFLCGRSGNTLLFLGPLANGETLKKRIASAPTQWALYRHNLGV